MLVKITSPFYSEPQCSHCKNCISYGNSVRLFPRDDPFPLKFWLQVTYPLLKAASFDTFCLDRTARRQFQATGQPVSRTQASDTMTSRLPRYEAKCVQRRCFQYGSVPLRLDIKGTELPPANILIPLERQLITIQLCR